MSWKADEILRNMPDMPSDDIYELARRGAIARLSELRDEANRLYAKFPELRESKDVAMPRQLGAGGAARDKPRRKYNMSTAMRKSVSSRMKAYWAARRAAKSVKKR